jgi:hypothetical protein
MTVLNLARPMSLSNSESSLTDLCTVFSALMRSSESLEDLEQSATAVLNRPPPRSREHLTESVIHDINTYEWTVDPRTQRLTCDVFERLSDSLHRIANEPSVGMHHITTHIHSKGEPRIAGMRNQLQGVARDADAALYVLNDAARTVRGMEELVTFKGIKDGIARSLALSEALLAPENSSRLAAGATPGSPIQAPTADLSFKSF